MLSLAFPARPASPGVVARRLRRRTRYGWRGVRWPFVGYAAAVVALCVHRRRLRLPRHPMVPVASTAPLAVAAALPRIKWRYAAVWAAYVWLFKVAWEIPYDRPEKLRARLRVKEPIQIDAAIGGGLPLGVRLQHALRDPPRLTALDYALTGVYYGLWLAPHAVLGWMLWRREEHFARAAGRLAAVYHVTTLGYWFLPTAPPWWASEEEGGMDGAIQRVTREVEIALTAKLLGGKGQSQRRGRERRDVRLGNPWGSMPSDHLPAAAITARSLGEISPVAGALGWAATAISGFALVYLGEHYVADLIVGLLVSEGIWRAEPLGLPFVHIGLAALRELERLVE